RLGVDTNGLEEMDRRILRCLARTPERAVGLKTIAASVGESEDTIEEVFEPHLLRLGLLEKTARGRIVTGRQRPDTASGVVFVTLEDETGHVNVVVWRALSERQRRELLGSRLMAVYGVIEREGEVVHLVAPAARRRERAPRAPAHPVTRLPLRQTITEAPQESVIPAYAG
ncbi:MAG: hypothetical protein HC807_02260, partial [Gammaproteobacteria bacterium]|nr:hypothetical protein [Gammaproteobacteria bacterium]